MGFPLDRALSTLSTCSRSAPSPRLLATPMKPDQHTAFGVSSVTFLVQVMYSGPPLWGPARPHNTMSGSKRREKTIAKWQPHRGGHFVTTPRIAPTVSTLLLNTPHPLPTGA